MAGEDRDVTVAPKRIIQRKTVLIIAGGLAVLLLLLILLCHFVGIRSASDMVAYHQMWREQYPPIWKDLALRRIKKGDHIETLLKKHAPLWRNDAGPYTELRYAASTAHPGLTVMAKEGKLIAAAASGGRWRHIFFEAPEQGESFAQAETNYLNRLHLESDAYKIHRAIAGGQDIFRSQHIERSQVPNTDPGYNEMMKQLQEIYGERYLQSMGAMQVELTVEVNEVLYGNLEPGTILNFPGDECDEADIEEPETVFLHFEDGGMIFAHAAGEPLYMTVPKSALEWYQSLTPEQIQDLESRWSAK